MVESLSAECSGLELLRLACPSPLFGPCPLAVASAGSLGEVERAALPSSQEPCLRPPGAPHLLLGPGEP